MQGSCFRTQRIIFLSFCCHGSRNVSSFQDKSPQVTMTDEDFKRTFLHQRFFRKLGTKYLGVTLTKNLTWDQHIGVITGKANLTLGFPRKNIKECTPKITKAFYKTI
ncbi:hypothetical protein MAR_008799, partial [Mya arenaria]